MFSTQLIEQVSIIVSFNYKIRQKDKEITRFDFSPSQAQRKPTTNGSATRPLSSRRGSHSGGEESLSRSASDSSVCNANANQPVHKKSAPGTPQPTHG